MKKTKFISSQSNIISWHKYYIFNRKIIIMNVRYPRGGYYDPYLPQQASISRPITGDSCGYPWVQVFLPSLTKSMLVGQAEHKKTQSSPPPSPTNYLKPDFTLLLSNCLPSGNYDSWMQCSLGQSMVLCNATASQQWSMTEMIDATFIESFGM